MFVKQVLYQKQQGPLLLRKKVRDLQDAQKLLTTAMLLGKVGVGIENDWFVAAANLVSVSEIPGKFV